MDQQPSGARPAVGELLRRYRETAGLSQEALAERAGLSSRGLLYLERGLRRPYPATLRRLADALSLTTQEREMLMRADRPGGAATPPAAEDTTEPPADRPAEQAAPADQAAIRSVGPMHNLPAALSSFIGREQAQAKVQGLLASHRLVTLVGAGGVGKTRLALAVGEGSLVAYPDGVWLVELAALTDSGLVSGTVAQVLGLHEEPGRPVIETLSDYCNGKRLLLVLDNCEHLLAACTALAGTLLRAASELSILATSREALGVAGERRYRVPSLSVPDPQRLPAPELAGSYEAVRLFVARAQERRNTFALTASNSRAVAEICARLDGIPLAIELAAARVGGMSVEMIAAHLDDRFRLLSTGSGDLPTRQRTLRATLDWSWDLLGSRERTLLSRFSVFAGGWTLEAAAVCAGEGMDYWAVVDGIDGLVNRSLVHWDESPEGAVRYRLLESARQHAAEQLVAAGEEAATRDGHLAYFLALADLADPELRGAEQGVWLDRLELEHDNLRAALGWARDREATELELRLAGALWRFWSMRDYFGEGRRRLEGALAAGGPVAPGTRAKALNAAGDLAAEQGDLGREVVLQEEALAIWRDLGDRPGIAVSLNRLAWAASLQGDFGRAVALREECLALQRALEDSSDIADSLSHLGWVTALRGDFERAVALDEEAMAIWRGLGNRTGIAYALNGLGRAAGWQGDFARATALDEEAMAICRELGDRTGIAGTLTHLGWVAGRQGDLTHAAALLEESLILQRELGDRRGIARSLSHLGPVVGRQGGHGRAPALLTESLRICRDIGARDLAAEGLEGMAYVVLARGQPGRAALLGGSAESLRTALGMPLPPALRADRAQLMQTIRAAVGEATFAAAWAEGQAMTLDEAIAPALKADPAGGL
jgi:predicted ATPase/transcriptional regulator with XRE-family HTH domain